jgi:hypothetical protein
MNALSCHTSGWAAGQCAWENFIDDKNTGASEEYYNFYATDVMNRAQQGVLEAYYHWHNDFTGFWVNDPGVSSCSMLPGGSQGATVFSKEDWATNGRWGTQLSFSPIYYLTNPNCNYDGYSYSSSSGYLYY